MTYTVIAVGKLKEQYFIEACEEYSRRLSPFCRTRIVELSEQKLSKDPSPAEINAALKKEADMIRQKLPKGALVVAMCIEGELLPSERLALTLAQAKIDGVSNVAFLIGGSNGLDEDIKKQADIRLSMSKMTFPHHLARVMLLEQIYRAENINGGGKYHK